MSHPCTSVLFFALINVVVVVALIRFSLSSCQVHLAVKAAITWMSIFGKRHVICCVTRTRQSLISLQLLLMASFHFCFFFSILSLPVAILFFLVFCCPGDIAGS